MARALVGAETVAGCAASRANALDRSGSFPGDDVRTLHAEGLLAAPLPTCMGGLGLCDPVAIPILRDILATVGRGSLSLGRLYEGHVNALQLIQLYAVPTVQARLAADARAGHLFGVWNTEPDPGGLALAPNGSSFVLSGTKSFASGAGHVTRPLVTARTSQDRRQMLVVPLQSGARADLSDWRVHGMRATATGVVDFNGLRVGTEAFIGEPDDYFRQPAFSGGAWRFLAVQFGGIQAVFEAYRYHLLRTGRSGDPHQRARLGEAAVAVETASLFVAQAAQCVATGADDADRVVAYVNLARRAVERAGLDVIQLAQRSVGLSGFLESHPLERLVRDLSTYLRQPGPDNALVSAAAYLLETDWPIQNLWQGSKTLGKP